MLDSSLSSFHSRLNFPEVSKSAQSKLISPRHHGNRYTAFFLKFLAGHAMAEIFCGFPDIQKKKARELCCPAGSVYKANLLPVELSSCTHKLYTTLHKIQHRKLDVVFCCWWSSLKLHANYAMSRASEDLPSKVLLKKDGICRVHVRQKSEVNVTCAS